MDMGGSSLIIYKGSMGSMGFPRPLITIDTFIKLNTYLKIDLEEVRIG